MATLDEAAVAHVARIARLALTPEETARLAAEASAILEHFAAVEAAGAGASEALSEASGTGGAALASRADEAAPPDAAQAEALAAQFPRREGRLCKVPGAL